MKVLTIITLLTLPLSWTWGASCESLKADIVRIQKAQLELQTEGEESGETLAGLQKKYNALMSELAILQGVEQLRKRYQENLDALNEDRGESLQELLDEVRAKKETWQDMATFSLLIGDVLQTGLSYQNNNLDNFGERHSSATDFFRDISARCADPPMERQHLCSNLPEYERLIRDFYDAYADETKSNRERKLRVLKNRLEDGIPGLARAATPHMINRRVETATSSLSGGATNTYVDDNRFEQMLTDYRNSTNTFGEQIDDLEEHLMLCAAKNNPVDGNGNAIDCGAKAGNLQDALRNYHNGIDNQLAAFGQAETLRRDLAKEFGDGAEESDLYERIQNLFNTEEQDPSSLMSNSTRRSLTNKLKSSLEIEKKQLQIQGSSHSSIDSKLSQLNGENPEDLERIYFNYLASQQLCNTQSGYTKDKLAECLTQLSSDGALDRIENRIKCIKKGQYENQTGNTVECQNPSGNKVQGMQQIQDKIDAIKRTKKFKDMEEMKRLFILEARNTCEDEDPYDHQELVVGNDTVQVCTDGYMEGCMSNNLNHITLLGETIAQVEESLPYTAGARRQTNKDRIEKVCRDDEMRALATGTCVGTATRNQVIRRYDTYYNGDPALGKKKGFGNLFNTALSRQIGSSTQNIMYWQFTYPMGTDSLYYDALWKKQWYHTQGQMSDLHDQWIDLNGYSNSWGSDWYYDYGTGNYRPTYFNTD